jgi:hypothetical protein
MKKNTKYIIGLICIIGISVVINGYIKNTKEGFENASCSEINKMIETYFNTSDYFMKFLDKVFNGINSKQKIDISIVQDSDNQVLSFIISFMFFIDSFNLILAEYPTVFIDLFENKEITDADFVVIYQFYNIVNKILRDINFTLLRITYKTRYLINLPITNVTSLKIDNATILNKTNSVIKNVITIMQKISENINSITGITITTNDIYYNDVKSFILFYDTVKTLKNCDLDIMKNIPDNKKERIFPFLKLVQKYVKNLSNSMNKYIAPALNRKLKDGQKIPIIDISTKPTVNENGSSVPVGDGLGSSTGGFGIESKLISGVGTPGI